MNLICPFYETEIKIFTASVLIYDLLFLTFYRTNFGRDSGHFVVFFKASFIKVSLSISKMRASSSLSIHMTANWK